MSLSLSPGVSVTPTEQGVVLLDTRGGRYWQVNGSGATALRLLLDGGTVDQAAAVLCRHTTTPVERAVRDVRAMVRTLEDARLVTT